MKGLLLTLKTRVSGYMTREGKWVDLHWDKRPTPKPKAPASKPLPSEESQLNLFSVLADKPELPPAPPDQPASVEPVAEEMPKEAPKKDPPKPRQKPQAGMNYDRPWAEVEASIPAFGAQAEWTAVQRKAANQAALPIVEALLGDGMVSGKAMRERVTKLVMGKKIPKDWRNVLSAYSGEGGIGDSLNEYYTPPSVAAAMWYLLRRHGLSSGHVLEPCAGTGVFQETKPAGISMTAVEWSPTSAAINAALHPEDEVQASAFEHFVSADATRYDAVVGNVPFGVRGAIAGFDKPTLGKAEEYFVDTCLDKTKDGGMVCLVVPHGIATNQTAKAFRRRVLAKAEVVGVHRLPNTAFKHSGTSVVTDILLLRKRDQDVANAMMTLNEGHMKKVGVWDSWWMDGKILEDPDRGARHGAIQENWRGGEDIVGEMTGIPEAVAMAPLDEPSQPLALDDIGRALETQPEVLAKAMRAAPKNPYPELATGTTRLINGELYILQGDPRRWHRAAEVGPFSYTSNSKEGQALALGLRIHEATQAVRNGLPISNLEQLRADVQAYIQAHGNPGGDKTLAAMAQQDPRFLPLLVSVTAEGKLSDLLEGRSPGMPASAEADWSNLDEVAEVLMGGETPGMVTVDVILDRWAGDHDADEVLRHMYGSDKYAVSLDGARWGLREDLTAGDLYPKLDAHEIALRGMSPGTPLHTQLERQRGWLLESIQPKTIEEVEVSLRSGFVPLECLSDYFTSIAQASSSVGDATVEVKFSDGVFTFLAKSESGKYVWFDQFYDKYLNRLPMQERAWDRIPDKEQRFKDWLSVSERWRGEVEEAYNRAFNSFHPKRYGDKPVIVPGWNPEMALNNYQHPGIRWALEEGKGILAYDVGLGKTAAAIAIAAKLREIGQGQRPTIVVPKSVTANWAAEIEKFRPGSSVMIIGETHTRTKDGRLVAKPDSKAERDKKWHLITQNQYDYILVTQPAFNEIDVNPIIKGQYVKDDFWTKRADSLDKATDRKRREILERYEQAMADKDFIKRSQAIYWDHLGIDLLIVDEGHCFPRGTLVDGRPIESLNIGDSIYAFNHALHAIEKKRITDVQRRIPKSMVTVHCGNGKRVTCTGNHPFFTQRGYVRADQLTILDFVYSMDLKTQGEVHARELFSMQKSVYAQSCSKMEKEDRSRRQVFLRTGMYGKMDGYASALEGGGSGGPSSPNRCFQGGIQGEDADKQSHEACRRQGENAIDAQGQRLEAHHARWKRAWTNLCSAITGLRSWMGHGGGRLYEGARERVSESLQDRYCEPDAQGGYRSRWIQPYVVGQEGARRQKREKIAGTRVDRVEVHQPTSDGTFGGMCPGGVVYNIEVEAHHNYFVDGVLVHNCYKNLFQARDRRGQTPKFLGGSGFAKRALDMSHKTKWLRDTHGGKGVYFLTATPTKNSPLEVYSMLYHIAPEEFSRRGIRHEEDFIDRYCDIEQRQVLGTDGQIAESPVVVGFKNMDELRSVMGRYIYRKTAEEVGLKLPEAAVQEHAVNMTAEQEAAYIDLRNLAKKASSDSGGDAHIFSIMDKMGKAAMDLSLLDPEAYADAKSPKLDAATKEIAARVADGGQIVFADQVPIHEKLKARLVKAGMKESEIGVINAQDAPDSARRQNIADAFVAGKLKVVIGNTATMGEGVNLQKFTSDIHHLDIPWEPASIQQRNGRGLRQGNTLERVRLHTYLAKRSFDGYRWQTVQGKRDWMDQLWHGGDRVANPAATQGTFGREELMIMMADDPTAARKELEANKEVQLAKYTAVKKKEASDMFRQYVKAKMNYGTMKDPATKTAQLLRQRVERLRADLGRHEQFANKALLDYDGPVLVTTHGHAFHPGAHFVFSGDGKGPTSEYEPATWAVESVNVDKRKVTMREVGKAISSTHRQATTTFDLEKLESGVTPTDAVSPGEELKKVIAGMTHPVAVKRFPRALVEEHFPAIQARLRTHQSLPPHESGARSSDTLWGIPAGRTKPEKIFPGSPEAKDATYIVPNTDTMHALYDEALREQEWNERYGSSGGGTYRRRQSSMRRDRFLTAMSDFHDWEERKHVLHKYKREKAERAAQIAKSRMTLTFKSFPGHSGRPGQRGGSQKRDIDDVRKGEQGRSKKADSKKSAHEENVERMIMKWIEKAFSSQKSNEQLVRELRWLLSHAGWNKEKIDAAATRFIENLKEVRGGLAKAVSVHPAYTFPTRLSSRPAIAPPSEPAASDRRLALRL